MFADADASLIFEIGWCFGADGTWRTTAAPRPTIVGAMTRATTVAAMDRPGAIAVYLRSRSWAELLRVPASLLTDRITDVEDVCRGFRFEASPMLGAELADLDIVERELMKRLNVAPSRDRAVQVAALASQVRRAGGRLGVEEMSRASGVSRQHLARLFRDYVGVSPKLYSRLARFRAALRDVSSRPSDGWSGLAARLGYADQSHLIAEFREFSGLTPEQLARGERVHPFVGDTARL